MTISWADEFGRVAIRGGEDISGMSLPVRCIHCWKVYDLGRVEVTERYADCSVWKAPCCKRTVDDREWLRRHYERIRG